MATTPVTALGPLKESFIAWAWPSVVSKAKRTVLGIFSGLESGSLFIIDEVSGEKHAFGPNSFDDTNDASGAESALLRVKITVKRESFWTRLLLFADLGFAEGYMFGDFECSDLSSFFRLFIQNRDKLNGGTTFLGSLSSMALRFVRHKNTPANSVRNIVAHYDLSNEMFETFLSKDMLYSSAIWQPTNLDGIDSPVESLEDAQQTKLLRFIEGAKIKPTDYVLDIGGGWGSFAIEAVKRTGCRVLAITISERQKELADQRIRLAGLEQRIEVRIVDYRELSAPEGGFDKIASIEMIEEVGEAYIGEYFACVHRLLKPDGGIAMFQCITIPEALHTAGARKTGFIYEYIFPGGYLPSTMELLNHINTQSKGTLTVEGVENIGVHYAKTLRLWGEKFRLHFDDRIKPSLLKHHPFMSEEDVEVFRRKWEYYFPYCEAGFATKTLNDVIITVSRPGAMELMEGIPL